MKQSFKFIHVIAIIAVIMIVVSLGLFVMKSSQNFVNTTNLTKYDIGEFNSLWKNYEKLQKGSTLKGLFNKLAKNAEENKNNPEMLVDVAYNTTGESEFIHIKSTTENPNVQAFKEARGQLVVKHAYEVEFVYNEKKDLITGILIKHGRNDKYEFLPDET